MDIDFEQYSLGMPRGGTVVLADHDTRWRVCFDAVSAAVGAGLGRFEIELRHVGSTAVPKIKAKPILDVLCIADDIEAFDALRHRMEEMDFVWKGEHGIPGRRFCVRYNREQTVSYVHLHAFRRGHPAVEEHLLFRDYLRARPEKAQQYENLKHTLAGKFASDRKNYTDGKEALIKTLIHEARTWTRMPPWECGAGAFSPPRTLTPGQNCWPETVPDPDGRFDVLVCVYPPSRASVPPLCLRH